MIDTDVCIIGAGPSGASASLMLSKLGIKHLIIDKAVFPRDKTCGDGLILHVLKALKTIDINLLEEFKKNPKFIASYYGNLHVSDQTFINIKESEKGEEDKHYLIYYGKRIDFDYFLVQKLNSDYSQTKFGTTIQTLKYTENGVLIELKDGTAIRSKLVIGADGIHSVVSKQLAQNKPDPKRTSTFISAYFDNIVELFDQNGAEIRVLYKKTTLFFYIFPLPNGQANVSLGGSTKDLLKHKINLKDEINTIIQSHPKVAHKFKNAKQLSGWRGWGIPYQYGHNTISGNRFMLVGDAAGLANSFYKEGVGTGMMSGVLSAQQAAKCVQENDFSANFIKEYNGNIEKEFGRLLKFSKVALRLSKHPLLFKLTIKTIKPKLEKSLKGIIRRRILD